MKLKNFSRTTFLFSTCIVGLLLIISLLAAFGEDEGTLQADDTFWYFFARLFYILRFPTHTLLWSLIIFGGSLTFFGGLLINCILYGLVIERIASLFKERNKK
jgi:hypothetical protein